MSALYEQFYEVKTEKALHDLLTELDKNIRVMEAMKYYAFVRAKKLNIGDAGSALDPETFLKNNIWKMNSKFEERVS